MINKNPVVSVCCIAFNHAKYIKQCLDGIVMQQTTFPFEIIIHDDASTDETQSIIKEYCDIYPNKIVPILQRSNQYSKGTKTILATFCYPRAKGKYIALCEGDDYWTDPQKLQKQVDFLESHPDYSMCFHNAIVHHEDGSHPDHPFAILQSREYDIRDNMEHWIVPTASLVFKREVYESPYFKEYLKSDKIMVGDYPLIQTCAKEGKMYGFSEFMSVYRQQPTGWTQQTNLSSKLAIKLIRQELEYRRIFGGYHKEYTPKAIARHSRAAISLLVKGHAKTAFKIWLIALRHAPLQTIIANSKFIFRTLMKNKL